MKNWCEQFQTNGFTIDKRCRHLLLCLCQEGVDCEEGSTLLMLVRVHLEDERVVAVGDTLGRNCLKNLRSGNKTATATGRPAGCSITNSFLDGDTTLHVPHTPASAESVCDTPLTADNRQFDDFKSAGFNNNL